VHFSTWSAVRGLFNQIIFLVKTFSLEISLTHGVSTGVSTSTVVGTDGVGDGTSGEVVRVTGAQFTAERLMTARVKRMLKMLKCILSSLLWNQPVICQILSERQESKERECGK
jgi:hypothetical protein